MQETRIRQMPISLLFYVAECKRRKYGFLTVPSRISRSVDRIGRIVPQVLVHGYAAGNGFWMFVLKELSAHFRVVCVEMYGCGRSDRLPFNAKGPAETVRHQSTIAAVDARLAFACLISVKLNKSCGSVFVKGPAETVRHQSTIAAVDACLLSVTLNLSCEAFS